jgi:hypothetical protein
VDLIKYVIEYDGILLLNKEYVADRFPMCIEWFAGNDLILEPNGFQKIKITDKLFILRKGTRKKGKTDIVPFMFLECVRRGDFERARKFLSFEIGDKQLKDYFGEFEILVNNYLERDDVFSILQKGSETAKSFVFEIVDGKIKNINDFG